MTSTRATHLPTTFTTCLFISLLVSAVAGCGGGGGGGGGSSSIGGGSAPPNNPPASNPYTPGVFPASDSFRYLCASPPPAGLPGSPGTRTDENNWLRSWSHELYLWYDEIVDRDPAGFTTPEYFELQKTEALSPSGAPKDRFHFTIPTLEWIALSQAGESAGYGARFELVSAAPPRQVVIAYVDAGTPAAAASLTRGTEIVAINGEPVATTSNTNLLNTALFPAQAGLSFTFTVRAVDASTTRDVELTSEITVADPVNVVSAIDTATGPVGYISFTEHIAPSELELIAATQSLLAANVTDLILDLRYNGGGFLDIANELAFMIAGTDNALDRVFDEIQFNDKYPTRNPVTNESLGPSFYLANAVGFSATPGLPLPEFGFDRVFVLTTSSTCSASEAIINGLRGIDIEVIQIGTTTCGKPYGFYAFDNCGTTYFSIQFRGVNAKGFGDYSDGFSPEDVNGIEGVPLPGCEAADDFGHALGDPQERLLATALSYRESGACPVQPLSSSETLQLRKQSTSGGSIVRPDYPGGVKQR